MNTLSSPVRWEEHFAPYGLGIENFFRQLDSYHDSGTAFPPYNVIRVSDTETLLQVATAGYDRSQLEVAVERGTLTVSAKKEEDAKDVVGTYSHKGIASRTFAKNWKLGENCIVGEVTYKDGLLTVPVHVQVPEEQKRRLLPIS